MKILIVGVSGFIGKGVFNELKNNHDVYGVSRSDLNLKNCFQLDLLNIEEARSFFKQKTFDVIIYLSSVMASTENIADQKLLLDNLHLHLNLIECLKIQKQGYLINFSSCAVYPNLDGKFLESSLVDPSRNPDCLYGLSKINSEILFKFYLKQMNLLNLRLGYVYGGGMNTTRIHKVFEKELSESNTITVWGNGIRTIPQISIDFLISVVKKLLKNPINGTFNLCEENISLKQLAENIIQKKGNSESKIKYVERGNKSQFEMDSSEIFSILK